MDSRSEKETDKQRETEVGSVSIIVEKVQFELNRPQKQDTWSR